MRIRDTTHEYLKAQAGRSGISITLAAQAILDHAATEGWEVGKVRVVKSDTGWSLNGYSPSIEDSHA